MPIDVVINDNSQPQTTSKFFAKRLEYLQDKYGILRIILEGQQADSKPAAKTEPLDGMTQVTASNRDSGKKFFVEFRQ
jgi:hypothetical protein